MTRLIQLTGLFLIAGLGATIAAPLWRAKGGVVFPPDKAKLLLRQCSRGVPTKIEGFWLPKPEQIAALEARLPAILETELSGERHPPIQYYLRQYAGLILGSRKIIYVNAFASYPNDSFVGKEREAGTWRTEPSIVCDGGNSFFGVEYDPQTKLFTGLAFNGVA